MKKLQKLFPLSFKFNKNVPTLILCAFLYLLIQIGLGLVLDIAIYPIVSTIFEVVFSPITIIAWVVFILGVILCCTVYGAIIGIPMMILVAPIVVIPSTVASFVMGIVSSMITIYIIAGVVVAILAYAGVFTEAKEEVTEE